jgi:hypothetical protein
VTRATMLPPNIGRLPAPGAQNPAADGIGRAFQRQAQWPHALRTRRRYE